MRGVRLRRAAARARSPSPCDARAFARQRAAAHVAQPAADRRDRVDVDDEQLLLEPGGPREHLALVVEHDRVPVEDQLVLSADRVAERDEARVVARAHLQHLLALAVLADVERRRRDVRDQLRAREREVGRRRAGLPDVLADRRPDEHVAEAQQEEVVARREVAVFVEDAVVRQVALAVDAAHLAVREHEAGVEEVGVEVRRADERGDAVRRLRDLVDRAPRGADEPGAEQQVLGRVAGDDELGEEDEVGVRAARPLEPFDERAALPSTSPTTLLIWASASLIGFRLSVENSTTTLPRARPGASSRRGRPRRGRRAKLEPAEHGESPCCRSR